MAAEKLVIDRLHIHAQGGRPAPAALKLGLQQALGQLQPARLPPQTILVIRRLASEAAYGPGSAASRHWQQQVAAQLDDQAQHARRPSSQHVPAQANSVLFADEVELLLCYTRDLLAGHSAWYWAELFPAAAYPGPPDGQRLLAAWQVYPQAIPQTLVALRPAEAAAALDRLDGRQLSRLAHCLHDTFALPRGALDATVPEAEQPAQFRPTAKVSGSPEGDFVAPTAPWAEWLAPGSYRALAPQAVYLLGLSYSLVRRPQQARQAAFGQQARRWLEQAVRAVGGAAQEPHLSTLRHDPATPGLTSPIGITPGVTPTATPAGEQAVSGKAETGSSEAGDVDSLDPWPEAGPLAPAIFTQLGGAIFLINLLTRLRLAEVFPALAGLNPWELLGGLVIGLLGPRADHYADDPLWAIISELAGLEPGQPWGAALVVPADPPAGDWSRAAGIFMAWPGWPEPGERLIDEAPSDFSELGGRLLAPGLAWWVQRLRPFLSQLLAQLTGDLVNAVESLLHQPASLYLSRTHIDLILSIEQISLPLRRAGLDQTPGWRPEFGAIVTIHFE